VQPQTPQQKAVVVDPAAPFPIGSIKVTGNQNFPEAEIIRLSGLRQGQMVRKPDFDEAQKRLLESGLFETVAYRYAPVGATVGTTQAYAATFEVKEIGQAYAYRFEAIELPDADLRAHLRQAEPLFGDRLPPTEPILKRFTAELEKYLASKNKPLPLAARLMPNSRNQLEIVFLPSSLPAVAQVTFAGNKALSTPTLQQAITGAGIGAIYTEPRFRQILDASIRPLYEAQGYVRVAFPKIETSPSKDVKGIDARVTVEEGAIFKLHEVKLAGELAEDTRLMKEGAFRLNEVIDMTSVDAGTKRMERALKRRGFLNAEAKIERQVDDKEKQVDLTINIDPGPQYRMGKLELNGLDVTTEPHIRKIWGLKEKQPFDFEYPDIFVNEMPNVLDNVGRVRPTLKPDPGTLTVDVILTFAAPEKAPDDPRRKKRPDQQGGGSVEFP